MKKSKSKLPEFIPPLPDGIKLGDFIAFYHDGWYYGRIEEQKGSAVSVLPGNKPSPKEHKIWVDISDIKKAQ